MLLILRIGTEIVLNSLKTDLTEQLKAFLTYFLLCVCLVRCVQHLSTVTWQLQQHAPCTRHAARSQRSIPPTEESVGLRTLCPGVRRVPLPAVPLESAIQVPRWYQVNVATRGLLIIEACLVVNWFALFYLLPFTAFCLHKTPFLVVPALRHEIDPGVPGQWFAAVADCCTERFDLCPAQFHSLGYFCRLGMMCQNG